MQKRTAAGRLSVTGDGVGSATEFVKTELSARSIFG